MSGTNYNKNKKLRTIIWIPIDKSIEERSKPFAEPLEIIHFDLSGEFQFGIKKLTSRSLFPPFLMIFYSQASSIDIPRFAHTQIVSFSRWSEGFCNWLPLCFLTVSFRKQGP